MLGPLEVAIDGNGVDLGKGGRRTVLAALLLAEGAPVATDDLISDIWGDQTPSNARTMVYGYVSKLRRILGSEDDAGPIRTHPHAYALHLEDAVVDHDLFRADLIRSERAIVREQVEDALDSIDRALGRWRGEICQGLALLGPAAVAAERIERERHRAELLRIDLMMRLGRIGDVIPELRRLIAAALDAVEDAARRDGADVVTLPGEGCIAAWGLRDAEADTAARAARLVLRLMAIGASDMAVAANIVSIAAGIATERMAVGSTGPADDLRAAGPTFAAARLLSRAEPGGVLVDRTTASLMPTGSRLEIGDHGIRVLAIRDADPGELLDRDAERATMRAAWRRCLDLGESLIVAIIGDPGMGKTSLVRDFLQAEDAPHVAIRCHRGPVPVLDQLCTALETLRSGDDRRDDVTAPAAERSLEDRYLSARTALRSIRSRPLAVIIDDLQWASETFHDVLARLARSVASQPIVFIVTSRGPLPADGDLRPDVTIGLAPLGDDAAESLLRLAAGRSMRPEVARELLLAASGNPLYSRQTAAYRDDLVSTFPASADDRNPEVPSSVELVLHARLDRLPRKHLDVLEAIVVLGETARRRLQEMLPASDPEAIDEAIGSLTRSGWLDDLGHPAHDLIHDAVLEAMDWQTRAAFHARAASLLEASGLDATEDLIAIGTHLEAHLDAVRSNGEAAAEASEVADHASDLLSTAGWRLVARGGHGAGTDLLGRAASLRRAWGLPSVELEIEHAFALIESGQIDEARDRLRTIDRDAAGRDPRLRAYARVADSAITLYGADDPEAVALAEETAREALPLLSLAEHERSVELTTYLLAWLQFTRGRLSEADGLLEGMIDAGSAVRVIRAGILEGAEPLDDRTMQQIELETAGFTGSRRAERSAQLATLYALKGDVERARSAADLALHLANEIDLPLTTATVSLSVGLAMSRLGQLEVAERHLRRSEDRFADTGNRNFRSTALAHLARVVVSLGRPGEVGELLALASTMCATEDVQTQVVIGAVRGRATVLAGDRLGLDDVRAGLERIAATEFEVERCDVLIDLAECHVADGTGHEAAALALEAIAGFERKRAFGAAQRTRETFADVL